MSVATGTSGAASLTEGEPGAAAPLSVKAKPADLSPLGSPVPIADRIRTLGTY